MEAGDFQERVVGEIVNSLGVLNLYMGHKMRLFEKMNQAGGPIDAAELANRADTSERYMKEWLECCAVHGYIKREEDGKFSLPAGHATVLLDRDSPFYTAAHTCWLPSCAKVVTEGHLENAWRTGAGVEYKHYGEDCLEAIGDGNRPMYVNEYVSEWIPKLPEIEAKLKSGEGKVLDFACGIGHSAIELSKGFGKIQVDGYDIDIPSYQRAQKNLEGQSDDVKSKVSFHQNLEDAGIDDGTYDLVTLFECLHDLPHPKEVLQKCKALAKPDSGVIFIADERICENLTEMTPTDPQGRVGSFSENEHNFLGRLNYSFSTLHCLPAVVAQSTISAAIGTAIRPSQVEHYVKEAGFSTCEVVHENDFFRFWKCKPQIKN